MDCFFYFIKGVRDEERKTISDKGERLSFAKSQYNNYWERKELKMKCIRKLRKAIAMILAIMLIIGVVPAGSLDLKNVKAADTGTAAFANLGNLGTVNIGSKSESGQWHKIKIGNDAVFCMDLGKACYTGYSYTSSEEETISSSSSNTGRALKARVAYWFDQTKKKSW